MPNLDAIEQAAKVVETVTSHPAGAGAAGGALFSMRYMPGTSIMEKLLNIFAATITAYFAAPVLAELFGATSSKWLAAIAALTGFIGMGLLGMLMDLLRAWFKQAEQYPIIDKLLGWIPGIKR